MCLCLCETAVLYPLLYRCVVCNTIINIQPLLLARTNEPMRVLLLLLLLHSSNCLFYENKKMSHHHASFIQEPGGQIERYVPPEPFCVVFIKRSFPIPSSQFHRADATHWTLNLSNFVGTGYSEIKECCLCVNGANVLDQSTALALYVKGSERPGMHESENNNLWEYRGCVTLSEPSNTFNLTWPIDPRTGAFYEDASIGVSLEPLDECLSKDAKISGSKELFAQRVALDLWNFLKSFTTGNETEHLVVPRNVFDNWFVKFTTKFRRDPDFLTRNQNVV